MDIDEAQALYEAALTRCIRDLGGAVLAEVWIDLSHPEDLHYWFAAPGSEHAQTLTVPPMNEETATVEVADLLQADVVEELWATWPPCPRHDHPCEAAICDDVACWVCPAEDRVVATIGYLNDATRRTAECRGGA